MERILMSIDDTNRKPLSFTEWMNKHIPVPGDGGQICEGTEKEGLNYTTY